MNFVIDSYFSSLLGTGMEKGNQRKQTEKNMNALLCFDKVYKSGSFINNIIIKNHYTTTNMV